MDIDKLGLGERIAGAAAVLLFIFMFFDWFSVSLSGGGLVGASGGVNAWDALDVIPIILVITILAALGACALRLTDSNFEPAVSANTVVAILGALSFLLILYRIVDTPGDGGGIVDVSPAFGIFVGLIAAAGIAYGGYVGMKAEGSDFRDLGSRLGGGGAPRA